MLTMAGSKMATRVAPSLLKAAGADGLIVDSFEEYEERAVSLATDPEKLFEVCCSMIIEKTNLLYYPFHIIYIYISYHMLYVHTEYCT